MYEIYIIILTGFAVFGLFCFIDTLFSFWDLAKFPPSVTVMKNSQDDVTFKKIKHIENNVPNNYTVFYSFDQTKSDEEQQRMLVEYLKNVLDVNKK